MTSQIDIAASAPAGLNKAETGILKRRPGLSQPRSISSPTTFTKSTNSVRTRPLPVSIADCEEGDSSPEDAGLQPLTPANTRTSVDSALPPLSTSGASALVHSQPPLSEVLSGQKDISGDANTVRERRPLRNRRLSRASQRPESLHLSESEVSMVTQDGTRHPARDTAQFNKGRRRGAQISPSVPSSALSSAPSDIFSERQPESRSDLSWSPEFTEYTISSQPPPGPFSPSFDPRFGTSHPFVPQHPVHQQYGTPDTPRGTASFAFFQAPQSPNPMAAVPLMSHQSQGDRPPLSGYELLAAKLTNEIEGPPIKPIYRRFDAINHRILLSLQDQIIALEETLDEIDATDSANREEGNIPACEREERESNHPFHAQKGAILGQLSQKLQCYNTLLTSFRDIQGQPVPTVGDIHDYKIFLDTERPIVDLETRFLNAPDLIVLEPNRKRGPVARNTQASRQTDKPNGWAIAQRVLLNRGPRQELVVGMVVATLGPLITFPVIRDFTGRMTIAVLFGAIACAILLRSGMINPLATTQDAQDLLVCSGAYVGGMAILSWLLR